MAPDSCPTCHDDGKILAMWERPGGPPGNGYVGCPHCTAGRAYDAAVQREIDKMRTKFRSNQQ